MKLVASCIILLSIFACGGMKNNSAPTVIEKTLWVNSYLGNCSEMELKEVYLLTQENDSIDPLAWECVHKKIEGYAFERGYLENIKVSVTIVEGMPKMAFKESIEKLRDMNYYKIHDIWSLTELYGKKLPENSIRPDMEINLNSLTVNGNGGCNTYRGSIVTYSGDKLKFGPIMSTKAACPDMEVEANFQQALDEVQRFELKGPNLIFNNEIGQTILQFKKVD